MVVVAKFGGTSAKDGATLEHVIDNILLANPERRVIVISAPGKRAKHDIKVTDSLIKAGEAYHSSGIYPQEAIDNLRDRFEAMVKDLNLERDFLAYEFQYLENAIRNYNENIRLYLDGIKPFGEIINAEILTKAIQKRGMPAGNCRPERIGMLTDGNYGGAKVIPEAYSRIRSSLMPVIDKTGTIIVVPGFYGVDSEGKFATFPRGGSDLTGAILANALDARLYENWSDEDGIRRADPRVVENPGTISRLTYEEARELAYSGAEILHPDTLLPLMDKGISLHVRNTFKPQVDGTYITSSHDYDGNTIQGIAVKNKFVTVRLTKTGMEEMNGYISQVTTILAEHGLPISHMTTSMDALLLSLIANDRKSDLDAALATVKMRNLVNSVGGVETRVDRSLVCVVGERIGDTLGIAEKLGSSLRSAGVNIEATFQGASPRSIIYAVNGPDAKKAVEAIYNIYFKHQQR